MGVRGEIFSTRLILPNRTYFLNVKENRMGDLYLNIVESKNKETGGFERQSVIVFADDLPSFLGEFDKSLKALEKAVREQKRSGGKRREENPEKGPGRYAEPGRQGGPQSGPRGRQEGSQGGLRGRQEGSQDRPRGRQESRSGSQGRQEGGRPQGGPRGRQEGGPRSLGGKRLVVKKKRRDLN